MKNISNKDISDSIAALVFRQDYLIGILYEMGGFHKDVLTKVYNNIANDSDHYHKKVVEALEKLEEEGK